eukprot:Amastigsp_a175683_243.p1 type:complete len:608 gc:universal Amastigsp_a175683_243:1877-54(-)
MLTNTVSLLLDAWSPQHHPYARRKLRELSSKSSHGVNIALALTVMVLLPPAVYALFATFLSAKDDRTTKGAVGGMIALCEVGMLHGLGSYIVHHLRLWGHSSDACPNWQAHTVARGKVLHLLGAVTVALSVVGLSSPLHAISFVLVLLSLGSGVAFVFYVLLKVAVDIKRFAVGHFASRHGPVFWAAVTALGCALAALFGAQNSWALGPMAFVLFAFAVTVKDVFVYTTKPPARDAAEADERRHLQFAMWLYRLLLYVLVGLVAALFFAAFLQESSVLAPCAANEKATKVNVLASPHADDVDPYVVAAEARAAGAQSPSAPGTEPYPICDLDFGDGLDVVDLALLSDIATASATGTCYVRDAERIFASYFDPADWSLRSEASESDLVGFIEAHSAARGLSVFAVRGTVPHRFLDIVQDFELYATLATIQVVSLVVPIAAWPDSAIAELVHAGSILHSFFDTPRRHYSTAVERAAAAALASGSRVVVTGHSLGGVIAQLVGARLGLRAVAFSSPGVSLARYRLALPARAVNRLINVVPQSDLVPLVERPVGLVQSIDCTGSAPQCHNLERTICELVRSCSHARTRPHARLHSRFNCSGFTAAHPLHET